MSNALPFLLELGIEEIPHWMIVPALGEVERLFREFLAQHQLEAGDLKIDGTPRRLVLRASALTERQADREELVIGPPKSAGPGAAMGFAKKNGVAVESLATEATAKGEYFALRRAIAGRETRALLAEALPVLVSKIPWPKAMYWTGKGGVTFIRPIRWVVALLGDSIVEFEVAGVKSGALSRGHRRMGADEIAFDHSNYEERLEKNGVILSAAKRRKRIQDGIKKLTKAAGVQLIPDPALLEDLVYLTEFPTPILGNFDVKFLDLPQEVLTTVMRFHQRYFTVKDAEGKMAPHFIAIMNMKADKKGFVVKGNERVLEARFNDARFFWEVDLQKKLSDRVGDLANVTFQAKLGSYLEKTNRVEALAGKIAAALGVDPVPAQRAARLAKTDLTTDMVKELTELQGVMGGLYARVQGETEAVSTAIYSHYKPQSMEDDIPPTIDGRILSVADKLDTLVSCFCIDLVPTGSKDPFGLRRAAQGIVKVLVEGQLRLNLKAIIHEQCAAFQAPTAPAATAPGTQVGITAEVVKPSGMLASEESLRNFFLDRIRYYFRDVKNFTYDEVSAVLAADPNHLPDLEARLFALRLVRQTENFDPLAAAFKRIGNILKQAGGASGEVNEALLEPGAERDLYDEMEKVLAAVRQCRKTDDYQRAFTIVATLRPAVDSFFDKVLVNAPDPAVRSNRLALLARLHHEVSSIADLSEIVTSSTSE
jgi:glycyl-tRNA synthetase beta chain